MEPFKIENYERIHGLGTFIPFRHLNKDEVARFVASLKRRLNLSDDITPQTLPTVIRGLSSLVKGFDAGKPGFNFQELLDYLNFRAPGAVDLIWSSYNDVDEIRTDDLVRHFDDIWYPSTDDLDIVDPQLEWLISIEHSGAASALNLKAS